LLGKTQDYLRAVLAAQNPNSILTAAWDEFYRVYNELIRRYVRARSIPEAEVEDCVQEVWLAVAKYLVYFKRPSNRPGLRAWLFTLVRTKATDVLRRRGRVPQHLEPALVESQAEDKPMDVWMRLLLQTMLDEVRKDESDQDCQILQMRLFDNRSVSETAEALNLTSSMVNYRYYRMLHKLRLRTAAYTGIVPKRP
jgi:RNA polymerase sigma factor (sigma-70 family)